MYLINITVRYKIPTSLVVVQHPSEHEVTCAVIVCATDMSKLNNIW